MTLPYLFRVDRLDLNAAADPPAARRYWKHAGYRLVETRTTPVWGVWTALDRLVASCQMARDDGRMIDLFVLRPYRRKGLATMLVETMVAAARAAGHDALSAAIPAKVASPLVKKFLLAQRFVARKEKILACGGRVCFFSRPIDKELAAWSPE